MAAVNSYDIKPCPCCGEEARIFKENSRWFDFFLVMCTECGLKTNSFNTPEEAVEKWNKRKDKKDMKEITRITTVELTQIFKVEDEADIKSKEEYKEAVKNVFKKLDLFDNTNVTNVQDFVREVE